MKELNILYNILADNSLLVDAPYLQPCHFSEYAKEFEAIQNIYHETQYVDKISLDMHDIILPKLEGFVPLKERAKVMCKSLFDSYHRDLALGKLKTIEAGTYENLRDQIKSILDESDQEFEKNQIEETAENMIEPFLQKIKDMRDGGEPMGMQLNTLHQMNDIIGGIMPTDLIGIYGKEKSSKSTLAMEMILDLSIDQKIPAAIFSYEMNNDLVLMKAISMRTGIDINHLRNPDKRFLPDSEFNQYASQVARKFFNTKLYLIDQLLDEYEIEAKCKKLAEQGVRIVLIDYLMLVSSRHKHDSVRNELNYLSKFFKRMAQRLNIAVILISQANDSGEREAEAKGLSRDSNYYFYIAKLEIGNQVEDRGVVVHTCQDDNEYVVKNRGLRHGKTGSFFITTFQDNIYKEKHFDHNFGKDNPI